MVVVFVVVVFVCIVSECTIMNINYTVLFSKFKINVFQIKMFSSPILNYVINASQLYCVETVLTRLF